MYFLKKEGERVGEHSMTSDNDGFARRFGELYQTQWIYGDGSVDLVSEIAKIAAAGETLAGQLGMEEVMEGAFRLFRPLLHTQTTDTLLLLERYESLAVWAVAETAAQTSPLWMSAVLANQDNNHTWLGDAYHMLDDALDVPRELTTDHLSVDWTVYDPTKKVALIEFPKMVRELAGHIVEAGFEDTAVRYFAMTTAAGSALNYAHLWLEHVSPAVLGEVLAWRQSAPELHDWRIRLNAICGEVISHQLLTQVA